LVVDISEQIQNRVLFTTYTGRFTVGPIIYWDYPAEWLALVDRAEKTCDVEVMRALHITYLLVEEGRREWFHNTCKVADWELKYDAGGRVYELKGE
jgi:hypothetical protein